LSALLTLLLPSSVTNTISKHPAGPGLIIEQVGGDITDLFFKHHHREGLLQLLEAQPNRIKRVGVMEREEVERGVLSRLLRRV
jgi:cytochrome b involved in lipid metabolism